MKLKDRLNAPKVPNINLKHKDDSEISEIFLKNETAEQIISDYISQNRNILVTGHSNCDKSLVITYIKTIKEGVDKLIDCGSGVKGLISAFENILGGKNGNIFCLNIMSYENIVENIKLLVSLRVPNLNEAKVDYILSVISPVIIHSAKDEDGLFYIENIGEIEYENDKIYLKKVYPEAESEVPQDESVVEEQPDEIPETPEEEKITNKYALLREKVRKKKNQ